MRPMWSDYEQCLLAICLWKEARGEGNEGMTAVGCVIRNRAKNPGWWGNSWDGVILKHLQFSSMTAPGDPQLAKYPPHWDQTFVDALYIAGGIYSDYIGDITEGANHFYDISIPPPSWADADKFVKQIGRIRFYRL